MLRYGRTLTFGWSSGKIGTVTDSASRSVGFGYAGDNLTTLTDAEGKSWTFGYDADHRVIWTKDPSNRTIIENDYDGESFAPHYEIGLIVHPGTREHIHRISGPDLRSGEWSIWNAAVSRGAVLG